MGSPEEADAALNNLESYEFEGRTLRMNYAQQKKKKPSPPPPLMPGPTFNMFVANLPFEAKSKDLKEFFIAEGADVVSAEVIFQDNHSNLEKKLKRPFLLSLTSRQFVKHRKEDGSQSDGTSGELESDKISSWELGGWGVYDRGSIFLQNSHQENSKILQNDIGCL
ncbi:hypothetical protein H0E87_004504 [Populus deltoides]|uniref:RRM domain-containing protein n=1 Tax=Populus deltoides TaxID=3696 RepID=A0A8T2ZFN1_POPDE|nr:hypothetical protein H0E87_004504 [Populus deltoides]